jgi:hypothetical protein
MTGWRVYPACLALVAVAACDSSAGNDTVRNAAAEPRILELGWVERSPEAGLSFRVERLVIRPEGWRLTASVTNRGSVGYLIQRPHRPRESMFGLVLLETASKEELRELTADFRKAPPFLEPVRIEPPLPRILREKSRWHGTLTGSTTLRKGSVVRVLFGRFVRVRGDPGYVLWVTDHAVQL